MPAKIRKDRQNNSCLMSEFEDDSPALMGDLRHLAGVLSDHLHHSPCSMSNRLHHETGYLHLHFRGAMSDHLNYSSCSMSSRLHHETCFSNDFEIHSYDGSASDILNNSSFSTIPMEEERITRLSEVESLYEQSDSPSCLDCSRCDNIQLSSTVSPSGIIMRRRGNSPKPDAWSKNCHLLTHVRQNADKAELISESSQGCRPSTSLWDKV
jgi:hypothetical protein